MLLNSHSASVDACQESGTGVGTWGVPEQTKIPLWSLQPKEETKQYP